jgi:hypothetical protein
MLFKKFFSCISKIQHKLQKLIYAETSMILFYDKLIYYYEVFNNV